MAGLEISEDLELSGLNQKGKQFYLVNNFSN